MRISHVHLRKIILPLRAPFQTHQGSVTVRELIIVEAEDDDGLKGYGEVTAFSAPFYTSETISTAWHMLVDVLIPQMKEMSIHHPSDFEKNVRWVQGNPMAKAGLEGALWDLYSKQQNISLREVLGGTRGYVKAGAVLSLSDHLEEDIKSLQKSGYQRFKLKVERGKENQVIEEVQKTAPDLPIMIDANGQYTSVDIPHLLSLDRYGLMMIEQPFSSGDFYLHSLLQKQSKTPVCLDESIMSYHDAVQAIQFNSCKIINIKISRVGGLSAAKQIHDYCTSHGVEVWCGGMVESGISKAHNLALASLENFTIPGDLSGSTRYFERDIIKPGIEVVKGQIEVPEGPGIGVEVDTSYLEDVTIEKVSKRIQERFS
ncbi:o-succinylbenzoate synthase [Halobacillus yeomjeoni]|uniref:o-succinylbenzoate synthase n=1 Tax=Halobacillus yeomjeoni TaxID=311194 RepID=UPI001CD6DAEF|nr:o-succinylbenzoate synthase [Halobacillus yeomjeoni]MCA0984476.1 o-succinylbenzoate synthase [Halobacillus yeomjeoni]